VTNQKRPSAATAPGTRRAIDSRDPALGEAIRALRGPRISQAELAARAGIHKTYLSGIERGTRNPSWTVVRALATGLDVSMVELVRVTETLRVLTGRR
jgi:transcriptional regulator with XRE-family HTH domain